MLGVVLLLLFLLCSCSCFCVCLVFVRHFFPSFFFLVFLRTFLQILDRLTIFTLPYPLPLPYHAYPGPHWAGDDNSASCSLLLLLVHSLIFIILKYRNFINRIHTFYTTVTLF